MIVNIQLKITLISQPLHTVMYVENSSNCWKLLRDSQTTTQIVISIVKKVYTIVGIKV